MNNHYIIVIVLVSFLFSFEKIDINNSNIDQLKKLKLSNEKIILIHNYLNNYGEIQSIYNLMNIKQLNSSDLELLKTVSKISKIPVIALAGAGEYQDFVDGYNVNKDLALAAANIFHFTELSVLNAKKYMIKNKISTRL